MTKRNNNESDSKFDPIKELAAVRQRHKSEVFRTSKLFHYLAELVQLRQIGASYQELREWLEMTQNIKVETSTVFRFLKASEQKKPKEKV